MFQEQFRELDEEFNRCLDQAEALLDAGYYDSHPEEWEKVNNYILAIKRDIEKLLADYARYVNEQ